MIIFILLTCLPFLYITEIIGLDTFLDSFENSENYVCIKNNKNSIESNFKTGNYIIIQKSTHPEFNVKKSDSIIYCENDGDITCNKVYQINNIGAIKRYHTTEENDITSQPIYQEAVIGLRKVLDNWQINGYNFANSRQGVQR